MRPWKDRALGPNDTVTCPKCGATVGIEVLQGRLRRITRTVTHIRPDSPTLVVCHATLKIEEQRRTLRLGEDR